MSLWVFGNPLHGEGCARPVSRFCFPRFFQRARVNEGVQKPPSLDYHDPQIPCVGIPGHNCFDCLNHQEGTKSAPFQHNCQLIKDWAETHLLSLLVIYISGVDNVLDEFLSRD